jgi:hypothetical protein
LIIRYSILASLNAKIKKEKKLCGGVTVKKQILVGILACGFLSLVDVAQADELETKFPTPGSVATKSEVLFTLPETNGELAQRDINLGRLNRHDYGYVGGGVNLGFNGNEATPIGDIGFLLNAKISLTPNVSLRPAFIFGDNSAFLFPVTYDFSLTKDDPFDPSPFVPYVGGGIAFSTEDNNSVGVVLTGGLDYRISSRFVGNAALNVGLMSERTDMGLMLSIGYILTGY